MKKMLLAVAIAIATLATATIAEAQQCQVVGASDGQLFPVEVRLNFGTGSKNEGSPWLPVLRPVPLPKGAKAPAGNGKLERVIAGLPAGAHTIHTVNAIEAFAQPVIYTVLSPTGQVVTKSEPTTEPRRVELKAGQKLQVTVLKPADSHRMICGSVEGVPIGIILERPLWCEGVNARKGGAGPALPNSFMFLVHKDWGIEKVAEDLAETLADRVTNPTMKGELVDCRTMWFRIVTGTELNYSVPETFIKKGEKENTKADLKKAFQVEITRLLKLWVNEKCFMLSTDMVDNMKGRGWLPANTKGPMIVSAADALTKYAPPVLADWEKK